MKKPTPIQIATYLHKVHQFAAAASADDPNQIVYRHMDILKLLKKCNISQPDFNGLKNVSNNKKDNEISDIKYLLLLSKKIRNARIAKGWNEQQLAKEMNVSLGMITRYESGQNLTSKTLLKLQKALDITLLSL